MREKSATSKSPHSSPDVPPPPGAEKIGEWGIDGYRDIFGVDRTVTDHAIHSYGLGSQSKDGSISNVSVQLAKGDWAHGGLNSDQARELAAALLQTANEIDRWWA